jgi:hypothetical protein
MQTAHYSEFIGLSPRAASLIEAHRLSPDETKDEILIRVLSALPRNWPSQKGPSMSGGAATMLDLGQGARVAVGEKLYLFLSEEAKKANKPDGIADVRTNGLAIDGKLIPASKTSYIHPAMVEVQKKKHHRNAKGEIISLSAWRQWYVLRENRLVRLNELKDPALARTRGRILRDSITLESLGL